MAACISVQTNGYSHSLVCGGRLRFHQNFFISICCIHKVILSFRSLKLFSLELHLSSLKFHVFLKLMFEYKIFSIEEMFLFNLFLSLQLENWLLFFSLFWLLIFPWCSFLIKNSGHLWAIFYFPCLSMDLVAFLLTCFKLSWLIIITTFDLHHFSLNNNKYKLYHKQLILKVVEVISLGFQSGWILISKKANQSFYCDWDVYNPFSGIWNELAL